MLLAKLKSNKCLAASEPQRSEFIHNTEIKYTINRGIHRKLQI